MQLYFFFLQEIDLRNYARYIGWVGVTILKNICHKKEIKIQNRPVMISKSWPKKTRSTNHYVRPSFTVSRLSRRIFFLVQPLLKMSRPYQGIEWISQQLAGLQCLTVLSMLISGITITLTGDWHSGRLAALSPILLRNSLLTEGKNSTDFRPVNVRTHQNYVSAVKHNCNVMILVHMQCLPCSTTKINRHPVTIFTTYSILCIFHIYFVVLLYIQNGVNTTYTCSEKSL